MRRETITVVPPGGMPGSGRSIVRVAFDRVDTETPDHRPAQEARVKYRAGRLFVRRSRWTDGTWSQWTPFRFEPRVGKSWDI